MKYFSDSLSRLVALIVLVPFVLTSCPMAYTPLSGGPPPVVITPGEGDPRYVYLDAAGAVTDTDQGTTGFYVENNPNAKGVVVISDDTGDEDLVLVKNSNNDSSVAIYFKEDANFPYYMTIRLGEEKILAWFSQYRSATESYDIIFSQNGSFETLKDLVLDGDLLNLYQDDPDLDSSQNRRLGNIVRALGIWGSLAAALEESAGDSRSIIARGLWGDLWSGIVNTVKKVVTAVAVIATVVAVVVAPIVSFINPAVGAVVETIAENVAAISIGILSLFPTDSTAESPPPVKLPPVLNVTLVGEDRWITNGEEFHIGKGQEIVLNFCGPGLDNTKITGIESLLQFPWQPGVSASSNDDYFEKSLEKNGASDEFQVRIKRKIATGFNGDGRIAYGFLFKSDDPENNDFVINSNSNGVLYKLPSEETASIHKDMVVVWFCIKPSCPNYVD